MIQPISNPPKTQQLGLTLAEVLVTLVILSFVMVGSGVAFQHMSPRWSLDHAKMQLMVDLKRAQLHQDGTQEKPLLITNYHGYSLTNPVLDRSLPRGVSLSWPEQGLTCDDNKKHCVIEVDGRLHTYDIIFVLKARDLERSVILERITGRVYAR